MKQILALSVLLTLSIPKLSFAQVNAVDSLALIDLYNSTDGPNWKQKTNWLTSAPLSTWHGVSLTTNGSNVFTLYLNSNKLNGTLPISLGNLSKLYELDLSVNQLKDTIPSTFGNFSQLQSLYLNNNQLTGSIPISLGLLPNLWTLYLSKNRLKGTIPHTFGTNQFLSLLYLDNNQLTGGLPTAFYGSSSLKQLVLNNNQLSGAISPSIRNMTNLTILNLASNQFSDSIPSTLKRLSNLQKLALEKNKFTFAGMNHVANMSLAFGGLPTYSPQARIKLTQKSDTIVTSGGGYRYFNTYNWYKGDTLLASNVGDSVFKPTLSGRYSAMVTNIIVTDLILYTDTLDITVTPLPLKNIALLVQNQGSFNWLNWTTISEENISSFLVQKSSDGAKFATIGTVKSKGAGNNAYQFSDNELLVSEKLYYRIVAIEMDGKYIYSKTVAVSNSVTPTTIILYPNPTKDILHVQASGMRSLKVVNSVGKVVASQMTTGNTNTSIQVAALSKGVYTVIVEIAGGKIEERRFLKD
jgi:Secretion system C-terminal sorting domain/Leucine rich repeat